MTDRSAVAELSVKKRLIKRKIMGMENLPALSKHVRNLMMMLRDPDADIDEIVREINREVSLVAQILKLVNSGYYALPQKVDSVDHAIALLGFNQVYELLLSTAVTTIISRREQTIWKHSYSSSVLAREIITQEGLSCSVRVPLMVLMHDIGKIVLFLYNETSYKLVENISLEEREIQYHLENRHLGVNHAEAGGWLAEHWNLEEDLVQTIMAHHGGNIPEEYFLEVGVIRIADYIDNLVRTRPIEPVSPGLLAKAGLNTLDLPKWISWHRENLAELDRECSLYGS
ncbi:MAG: HDOD domain-containing protein [Lentisphaerae bacterium]|nr:MAG: HDOD domain-containing protein [Lentisphaerota bacterium]